MARWKDLPLEVINLILNYVEDDNIDINILQFACLSRLSKAFYIHVRPFLYKHIRISQSRLRGSTRPTSSEDLFARSLSENPDLARLPRSMTITCLFQDDDQVASFQHLLKSLPLLKELNIKAFSATLDCLDLTEDMAPNLRCLNILRQRHLKWYQVIQYMHLPQLESLIVGSFGPDDNADRAAAGRQMAVAGSTVKSLSINLDAECSADFDTVLSHCPSLESLTCTFSWSGGYYSHSMMSIENLSRTLENRLSKNLTRLHLKCKVSMYIENDFPIDLSPFTSITELEIDAMFLFDTNAMRYPSMREGVHTRLPPALKNLQIVFASNSAAFEIYDDDFPELEETATRENIPVVYELQNLTWLVEITTLPCLSHVHVLENHQLRRCGISYDEADHIDPPGVIDAAFAKKGINLELWIRPRLHPKWRHSSYLRMTKPKRFKPGPVLTLKSR
ncbi:hypothetical protein FQN49_002434 [Arthroderma sp. PD_2]|nr:hypothetical protein FQN49_002434 [Arthroderma sp. PD_2]